MGNPTENQSFDLPFSLRQSDADSRAFLNEILSRGAFALKARTVTAAESINPKYPIYIADTTSGTFALTVPAANYWGANRTPILTVVNIGATNAVTLNASGTDTISGAASYSCSAGNSVQLVSDGISKWYAFPFTVATGSGIYLLKALNLSDLANVATARTNLGLGSLATVSNLTGPITSVGAATAIASQTGTGTTFAMSASPVFSGEVKISGTASRYSLWNNAATSKWEILNGLSNDNDGIFSIYDRITGQSVLAFDQLGSSHFMGSTGLRFTPTTTTTWYRIGSFFASNMAQSVQLYIFALRVSGSGHHYIKLTLSKSTPSGNTAGVTGEFQLLGQYTPTYGIAELRIISGATNAASYVDIRFNDISSQWDLYAQAINNTATNGTGTLFTVDSSFTPQGTGASGQPIDAINTQRAYYNDYVSPYWYQVILTNGNMGLGGIPAIYNRLDIIKSSTNGDVTTAHQVRIGVDTNTAYSFYQGYYFNGSSYVGILQTYDNGTPSHLLLSPSGGNVAIGTTNNPSGKLHVEGSTVGKGGAIGHHVDAYGAVGDGTTDDSTNVQAAFDAAIAGTNGSSTVVFGAKDYKLASVVSAALSASTLTIKGEGSGGGKKTKIITNSNSAFKFTSATNNTSSIRIEDIAFYSTSTLATGSVTGATNATPIVITHTAHGRASGDTVLITGVGGNTAANSYWTITVVDANSYSLNTSVGNGAYTTGGTIQPMLPAIHFGTIGNTSDALSNHVFKNVYTDGYPIGIKLLKVRKINMQNVVCRGERSGGGSLSGCLGIHIDGVGDSIFNACEFSSIGDTNTGSAAVFCESSSALKFTNCWTYYGGKASFYYRNKSGVVIGDVAITACQFDFSGGGAPGTSNACYFESISGGFRDLKVTDTYCQGFTNGIYCAGTGDTISFKGNHIAEMVSYPIYCSGMKGISIIDNHFYNCGDSGISDDACITIDGGNDIAITGNTHTPATTPNVDYMVKLQNSATRWRVENNPGYVAIGEILNNGSISAAVASANNLTLTNPGIEYRYQISGTTQINLLNKGGWRQGDEVTLHFQSTPTVKHNQTGSGNNRGIMLSGSVDFAATANDQLKLQYDELDFKWYETARTII